MAKKHHRKVAKKSKRKVVGVKANVSVKKNRAKPVVLTPQPPLSPIPQVPVGPESFDIEEWMDEQGLKRGVWEIYYKSYDKEFCEIRRKDGSELAPCWPNAGKFVWMVDESVEVSESDVTHIRYFKTKHKVIHEDDEWGRDMEEEDEPEDTDDGGD